MRDRIEVESKIGQLFLEEEVALLKEEREGVAVFILGLSHIVVFASVCCPPVLLPVVLGAPLWDATLDRG